MDIITRQQAQDLGLKLWFSGVPCKRGHVAPRRVSPNACVECLKAQKRKPPASECTCEHCGALFTPQAKSKRVRFCSAQCNSAFNNARLSQRRASAKAEREALLQWLPGYMPRAKARQLGLSTYFVGKPCPRGHVAPHHVAGGCIVCAADYARQWQSRHRALHRQECRERDRLRVRPRTDEVRAKEAARRSARKGELSAYRRNYAATRTKSDPSFKFANCLRSLVIAAIKKQFGSKAYRTHDLIGCTVPELMAHLELQFAEGMTWENHGRDGWHIDHIRPCASFDLTDPEQQRQCFHYSNLQPLWAADNIRKGARVA